MDILVIGGTTFFGRDIVELSLENGHKVTVFSRGNQRPGFWDRVEHIAGDRSDHADFAGKLTGRSFDVVVDNIAFNDNDVRSALEIFKGHIGRYVLTSSVAVYIGASPFDIPFSEDDAKFDVGENPQFLLFPPPTPSDFCRYATGKIAAEQAVLEQDDVSYTIVRPPSVIGPEDPTNRCQFYFRRLLDGGPLILTNGGVYSTQPVYHRDLAQGYLLAMTSEKAVNQVYHFAQEKANRTIDWVQLAAEFLDVEPDIVSIPADVLQQSPFNYEEPWTYIGTLTLDLSKARTELGFKSKPVEIWLASTAKWYREQGYKSDSSDDSNRQAEIAFAQKYRQLASQLEGSA